MPALDPPDWYSQERLSLRGSALTAPPVLDAFTRGYCEAAVEHTKRSYYTAPTDYPLGVDDINDRALARMVASCESFQQQHADDLAGCDMTRAGRDFWHSRRNDYYEEAAGFHSIAGIDTYGPDRARRLDNEARYLGRSSMYISDSEFCLY